jgi:aminoglycoside 3-N-acetyltransferase
VRAVVTHADIERGLDALGLRGESVAAHASLKSFGWVEGGAGAVIGAFTAVFRNLLMPSGNWGEGSALVAPPADERIEHNGLDQGYLESLPIRPRPFDPARTPILSAMGAIPRALHTTPGTLRSGHPVASWLAHGADSALLIEDHDWNEPQLILRRLAYLRGWVLLCGVGLQACTALHLAEQYAGRRGFVRWVICADGSTARVGVGGCSDGFDQLWPRLRDLFRIEQVGNAELRAAPLVALIERAAEVFVNEPELSICRPTCVRCRDASANLTCLASGSNPNGIHG